MLSFQVNRLSSLVQPQRKYIQRVHSSQNKSHARSAILRMRNLPASTVKFFYKEIDGDIFKMLDWTFLTTNGAANTTSTLRKGKIILEGVKFETCVDKSKRDQKVVLHNVLYSNCVVFAAEKLRCCSELTFQYISYRIMFR